MKHFSDPCSKFRPQLEHLEDRLAPSATVTGSLDKLSIQGDDLPQVIEVLAYDSFTRVTVDGNGDGDYNDPGEMYRRILGPFSNFDIRTAGGEDFVWIRPLGNNVNRTINIFADMGSAKDRFELDDDGSAIFNNSHVNVQVLCGDGSDHVRTDDPPHQINGSTYLINVDLGTGNNAYRMNLDADYSQGSTYAINFVGSNKPTDVDNIYTNMLANVWDSADVSVNGSLLSGNDIFNCNVKTYFNLKAAPGKVHLHIDGGDGDDVMTITSLDRLDGHGMDVHGLFDLQFLGGNGNDTLQANLTGGDGLEMDGDLLLRIDGGAGNDIISVRLMNTATSRGNYDIALYGGAQDDKVTFSLEDRSLGMVSFHNSTTADNSVLLDGGDGTLDQATVIVPVWVPVTKVNFEL